MQELLGLILRRLEQGYKITLLETQSIDFPTAYARFQLNEALRKDRQNCIFATHSNIDLQLSQNPQICNQLRHLIFQFSFLQYQEKPNLQLNSSNKIQIAMDLQKLSQQSKAIIASLRDRISKRSYHFHSFYSAINNFSNNFGELITGFAEKMGLLDDLGDQTDKNMKSLVQIWQESNKANIRIANCSKNYMDEYKAYGQKIYKRRVKTLAASSQKPKKLQRLEQNELRNVSPVKRNFIANALKHRQLQRNEKAAFPSTYKKIEFPQIYSVKANPLPFSRGIRKQSTKKVMTVPNDRIYLPTYRFETQMTTTTKKQRLKNILDPELQEAKLVTRLRDRLESRKERGKFEANLCFDDSFLKKGIDERLLASDKGLH